MPVLRLDTVKLNYLQLAPQGNAATPFSHTSSDFDSTSPGGHPTLVKEEGIPNLVMVHGLAASLAFWYHLTPAFVETNCVTLFDLRGHGRSSMPEQGYTPGQMAEDLKQLMDALGIQTASLVGHSFGGSVLLHFAVRYPERVDRIILADVRLKLFQPYQRPCDWPYWEKLQPTLSKFDIHLREDEPEAGYQILTAMAQLQVSNSEQEAPFPRLLSQLFPQGGSKRTAERWLQLLDTTTAWDDFCFGEAIALEALQQLHKPTLAIYGEHSPTLPTADALRNLWPHLHFERVSNAGHFFPVSQPDQFIQVVKSFLSSDS